MVAMFVRLEDVGSFYLEAVAAGTCGSQAKCLLTALMTGLSCRLVIDPISIDVVAILEQNPAFATSL